MFRVIALTLYLTATLSANPVLTSAPSRDVCSSVDSAAAPGFPLRDPTKPFHANLLGDYVRLLSSRFPEFKLSDAGAASKHLKDKVIALAESPDAIHRDNRDGHHFRFDPNGNFFAIYSKEGEVVACWQLEPGALLHGYSSHRSFFDAVSNAKTGNLRVGLGVGDAVGFSPSSAAQHHNKHKGEFGNIPQAEYERRALAFAKAPVSRSLTLEYTAEGAPHRMKFNPSTNEFVVLRYDKAQTAWRVQTYYIGNPTIHGYRTNFEFFLSHTRGK